MTTHETPGPHGYLGEPPPSPGLDQLVADDLADMGFVMNLSRAWGHAPHLQTELFDLLGSTVREAGLTMRERGLLVTACAAARGDSYCALAWGERLAATAGTEVAAAVLGGVPESVADLPPRDRALVAWATQTVRAPHETSPEDVAALREAGFEDRQILAITAFVALRLAFSTVNAALGVPPDAELAARVPDEVRHAVTYGRPVAPA